jgi:hypothetical protein
MLTDWLGSALMLKLKNIAGNQKFMHIVLFVGLKKLIVFSSDFNPVV